MSADKVFTQVTIVGGGISGLKAAQTLAQHGVKFQLLEARDRFGGRIHTVYGDGINYDLGASWAHDTLANPLFDEMAIEDHKSKKYDLFYDDGKQYLFTNDPAIKFDDNDLKLDQVTSELNKYIELEFFENLDKKDASLHEMVMSYLFKQRKMLTSEQIDYAPQLIRNLELWHGISWDSMSSKFALVDNVGRNCLIRGGYGKLIEDIMGKLPGEFMHKDQIVKMIDRRDRDKIIVETIDGTQYCSDYVIVTVPQSILQLKSPEEKGHIEFLPKLSSSIEEALDNMSFGKLGKVIFEFPSNFWKEHHNNERFVAIADPECNVKEFLEQDILPQIKESNQMATSNVTLPTPWSFPVLILNLSKIYRTNDKHSLLVFTQGDLTEYLESNPDKAWDYMKPILSKLTAEVDIPDPIHTICTQWTIDPFSRGSYAACEPGNDPTDLVIRLSQGLGNLRFAGEHTILDGAGAVHGAWMSGLREANFILEQLELIDKTDSY